MPEAEEGNRTEDGKIVQVRSNVACANKWCKCGQMARRQNVACADKCCRCSRLLHVRRNVANHVDGEKAMKERKFEALQKKIMKIKSAKEKGNEKERV